MKTTVQLDYPAILANSAQPVHLAFHFTAPGHDGHRDRPIAFSVVLDRSGSMRGEPLTSALRAAKTVVQNLRREDHFALITFDDAAEVVIPMGPVSNQPAVLDRIDRIRPGGRAHLTGGWMLGREALRSTPAGSHPGTFRCDAFSRRAMGHPFIPRGRSRHLRLAQPGGAPSRYPPPRTPARRTPA